MHLKWNSKVWKFEHELWSNNSFQFLKRRLTLSIPVPNMILLQQICQDIHPSQVSLNKLVIVVSKIEERFQLNNFLRHKPINDGLNFLHIHFHHPLVNHMPREMNLLTAELTLLKFSEKEFRRSHPEFWFQFLTLSKSFFYKNYFLINTYYQQISSIVKAYLPIL